MIYAIGAVGTDYVKFGVAKYPEQRLRDHQVSSPHDLEFLAICEGGRDEERYVHHVLLTAGAHVRGEWFKHCEATAAIIWKMQHGGIKAEVVHDSAMRRANRLLRPDVQQITGERKAGGWKVERKPRKPYKAMNWDAWLKDWEERSKRKSTAQGLSIAHAREAKRRLGRFAPSIARAGAEKAANSPQCANSEIPNQISGAISPTPM